MIRRLIGVLGIPGILSVGLGLFSLSFYFGNVAPAESLLATMDRDALRLKAQLAQLPKREERGASEPTILPVAADVPALIARLGEIGDKSGFAIDRAAFRQIDDGKLRRLEVALPLKGTYPAIRAFLREAATQSAATTIDEITLSRGSRADATVDAQIRLSYYFAAP